MKVLNLYAGIGGNRKLWENVEVTAVEINEDIASIYSGLFPDDKIIVDDAHEFLLNHHKEYDFIWASPPCPTHSRMMRATRHEIVKYPDMKLYQEVIYLTHFHKKKFVVENVIPYYEPLIPAQKVGRHLFWANFKITKFEPPKITDIVQGIDSNSVTDAKKEVLMDYLGIYIDKNIYDGSHDERKVLRNCVHPELGKHIFNAARGIIEKSKTKQLEIEL